eukprot:TRINITY_DN2695_c0_g1_i2.p1 TRINITY_DN2695_c0_g1~~TRINITY_DN2695_c0_g1_i2.p1  ORF type:complete len:244 (+),score=26.51 TRINITY_DN2695_c0_g1_i2:64-795(+)
MCIRDRLNENFTPCTPPRAEKPSCIQSPFTPPKQIAPLGRSPSYLSKGKENSESPEPMRFNSPPSKRVQKAANSVQIRRQTSQNDDYHDYHPTLWNEMSGIEDRKICDFDMEEDSIASHPMKEPQEILLNADQSRMTWHVDMVAGDHTPRDYDYDESSIQITHHTPIRRHYDEISQKGPSALDDSLYGDDSLLPRIAPDKHHQSQAFSRGKDGSTEDHPFEDGNGPMRNSEPSQAESQTVKVK